MNCCISIIDKLNRAAFLFIGLLLGIMAIVIILQVFARIIGASLPWSEELSRYLMIYIVFVGSGYALRTGQLMAVNALQNTLKPALRRLSFLLVNCLVMGFSLLLVTQGQAILKVVGRQVSPAMGLSMAVPYAAIAIGGAFMALNAFVGIVEILRDKENCS